MVKTDLYEACKIKAFILVENRLILLMFIAFMTGCSIENFDPKPPHTTGYILEVDGKGLLVAERISSKEFDEIKDIPIEELMDRNLSLLYITYDDVKGFKVGNEIDIWLDGEEIEASYPGKAKAMKIELKK
ncbi:DUF3221 domain-containing protein [Sutcliffiella cohnii]